MANIEPLTNSDQSLSDDQELAKVLAGVGQQADEAVAAGAGTIAPTSDDTSSTATDDDTAILPEPSTDDEAVNATLPTLDAPSETPEEPAPVIAPTPSVSSSLSGSDDLTGVKQEALTELRPLVDKLNIPAEEKFDTYLLLLRSTDDKSLIEPAHETAKLIEDESRRAQALLDIIKEIDFLTNTK